MLLARVIWRDRRGGFKNPSGVKTTTKRENSIQFNRDSCVYHLTDDFGFRIPQHMASSLCYAILIWPDANCLTPLELIWSLEFCICLVSLSSPVSGAHMVRPQQVYLPCRLFRLLCCGCWCIHICYQREDERLIRKGIWWIYLDSGTHTQVSFLGWNDKSFRMENGYHLDGETLSLSPICPFSQRGRPDALGCERRYLHFPTHVALYTTTTLLCVWGPLKVKHTAKVVTSRDPSAIVK